MRHTSFLILIAILSLLCSLVFPHNSRSHNEQNPNTKDGLEITAEIDSDTYQLKRDDILLTVTLKNVSQTPITICKRWVWDKMLFSSINIGDAQDRLVHSVVIVERRNEPPLSKDDFLTIPSGQFIKKKQIVPPDNFDFNRPGDYRLAVSFYSFYSEQDAPAGVKFWDKKHGEIRSTPVRFRVVD